MVAEVVFEEVPGLLALHLRNIHYGDNIAPVQKRQYSIFSPQEDLIASRFAKSVGIFTYSILFNICQYLSSISVTISSSLPIPWQVDLLSRLSHGETSTPSQESLPAHNLFYVVVDAKLSC